jgi:hypothetical protein
MDWVLNKFSELRNAGMGSFLFTISTFLFIDSFCITIWGCNMNAAFTKLSPQDMAIIVIAYFFVFYVIEFFRRLINSFISAPLHNAFDGDEYYSLNELFDHSIKESSSVKYNIYLRIKSEIDIQNATKALAFITFIISLFDFYCVDGSILQTAFMKYKIPTATIMAAFWIVSSFSGLFLKDGDDFKKISIKKEMI